MKKFLILFATLAVLASCGPIGPDFETYNVAIMINEGGPQMPIDMIGFNEDDLVEETKRMSTNNESQLIGTFHGLLADSYGYGYPLLSDHDGLGKIDLSRFKIEDQNFVTELSNPVAMCVVGENLYVLNNGRDGVAANIKVYSMVDGYNIIETIPVNEGGTAMFEVGGNIYICGKAGLEVYEYASKMLIKTIELPARPMEIAVSPNGSNIIVSCKDYGISIIDYTTDRLVKNIQVPVGPKGRIIFGRKASHILSYSGDVVYQTDITTDKYEEVYRGNSIRGIGVSPNSEYIYIADDNGATQRVFSEGAKKQLAEVYTSEGDYCYMFSARLIEIVKDEEDK